MGIPGHLTCLLGNLCSGQEARVRNAHGETYWFQIGKGVCQGCILSTCLFNLYAEYIMRNAGLDEAQAGIKIAGRNINNMICRWHHTYGRKGRTKEPLDESEKGEWKSWLKTQFKKQRSWHLVPSLHGKWMGKQWKQRPTLFFWAPKSLQMLTATMKLKDISSLKEKLWQT